MIQEEQKFNNVRDFLDNEIVRLSALIKEYREDIKVQGEDFNRDNPNGGMYSGMELTEIHYEMEKKMLYSQEAANDIDFYGKLRNSPYFARVDFKIDGALKEKSVYIGLRTLQDPDTFEMYVCDWRAPIASLFYEDFTDKAFFDAPRGRLYGDLLLKRQYKFKDGALQYYTDSDVKIDDDILLDVLSTSSGEHLKVIVNSIQREQNKVVRYNDSENLLVTGPAGSGKTSVGFHRLAFLLYRNREELSSAEIVMFSNNDIFSSYVADIIPELGEMPISYASFYSIFTAEMPTMNVGDYYSLAEAILNGDSHRHGSASVKMSKEFIDYIDRQGNLIEPDFSDVCFDNKVIISRDELKNRFLNDGENSPKARGERLAAFVQTVIDTYFSENYKEIYAQADRETTIDEDTNKVVKQLRRGVKGSAVEMIKNATMPDPVVIYFNILRKFAEEKNDMSLLSSARSLERGYVEFEDALGVVLLKTVMGTSAVLSGVKHILVDEAQDMSLIQHEIIKRMFPRARFTLLADTNQAIIGGINSVESEEIASIYNAKSLHLNKSYRSTKEINTFALSLLPPESRYEIFERTGEKVVEESGSADELIEKIISQSETGKTMAVITLTQQEARDLYSKIKSKTDKIRLCDNKSCQLSQAPVVMPLALTKGLEFDTVIVVDNGSFSNDESKKHLYLATTRALHKLNIFTIE
jgi:DNA helicase-2/ATP-dependent DNA helicase PcrA